MRVLILTSSEKGTALTALKKLVLEENIVIEGIIISKKLNLKTFKFYKNKFKKILKIGFLGAINGVRIRSWFQYDQNELTTLPEIANIHNIPVHYVDLINSEFTKKIINQSSAVLGLSLGNSYIVPSVFNSFQLGMINIHGEVLPKYQNAQSIIWQLYNNSKNTGFTIHKIENKIDAGMILIKDEFPIIFKSTLKETISYNSKIIADKSTDALVKVLLNYNSYSINAKTQTNSSHYTTPSFWQFLRILMNFKKLKQA